MPTIGVEEVTPTETHGASGVDNVDALLSGSKYSADAGSTTTTLTYSFPNANSLFSEHETAGYGTSDAEPYDGLEGISPTAQSLFKGAVANIERFSNLTFQEVADEGDSAGTIRIAWTTYNENGEDNSVGWAYLPGNNYAAGDIWLRSDISSENDVDFIQTIFHEFGHALGLKHSFEAENEFPALETAFEGNDYTVMSYTVSSRFPDATWTDLWPQSYMYFDILALQEIYGVDTETTGGADSYSYDLGSRFYLTIWDAGGTDTLSVTGGSTNVHINLNPGTWSNVGTTIEYGNNSEVFTDDYTVYIADDTTIENGVGASGDDTLEGNSASNSLKGNGGNDLLLGGGAGDTLVGHAGHDIALAGDGDDAIWAGSGDSGNDIAVGGAGDDILGGGAGDDLLVGGGFDEGSTRQLSSQSEAATLDGDDTLYGSDGNDTVLGGGWDDGAVNDNGRFDDGEQVTSGTGDNILWAGNGNDLVYGAAGSDIIGGRDGSDTIHAGDGDDTVYGGSSDDADFITG
ncbi:MAG: matrixin family metalloprotease, partial [Kordiimonadaceae bacterium]|nr:matrixin family metalloprotease [Kordiimonadaceae bacterium]